MSEVGNCTNGGWYNVLPCLWGHYPCSALTVPPSLSASSHRFDITQAALLPKLPEAWGGDTGVFCTLSNLPGDHLMCHLEWTFDLALTLSINNCFGSILLKTQHPTAVGLLWKLKSREQTVSSCASLGCWICVCVCVYIVCFAVCVCVCLHLPWILLYVYLCL